MQTIYKPKGAAREYSALALNIYQGCAHDCEYCYVRGMPMWRANPREKFANPEVRVGMLDALKCRAHRGALKGETGQVLLCFTCDPYQPIEKYAYKTHWSIFYLHAEGFGVNVLTKAGELPLRDLDLFDQRDSFGITLTTISDSIASEFECNAAPPTERIATLRRFHERKIDTWVSFEPVLNPDWTLEAIEQIAPIVNRVKIGKWNHDSRANAIDWHKFKNNAVALCKRLDVEYTLKQDLLKAAKE